MQSFFNDSEAKRETETNYKSRIFSERLDNVLWRCEEFKHMRGKFTTRKTNDICPRISALQKSLGFMPGEPLNASNFHRLIPATKDIHCILGRPMCYSPTGNIYGSKSPSQIGVSPYFKVHKARHHPYEKTDQSSPNIKKQHGFTNSLVYQSTSNSRANLNVSNSEKYPSASSFNKRFNGSHLNSSVSYSNKNFSVSGMSWHTSKSNDSFSLSTSNEELNISDSRQDLDVSRLYKDYNTKIPNNFVKSNKDAYILNPNKRLRVLKLNDSFDQPYIYKNISCPDNSFNSSVINSHETRSCQSALNKFKFLD